MTQNIRNWYILVHKLGCKDPLVKPLWNDFPWTALERVWFPITTSGHVCLSGCVRMFFKHSWLCHSCLKIIPTCPLRHVWPEVVMEIHTHTSAVHGKSHTHISNLNSIHIVENYQNGVLSLQSVGKSHVHTLQQFDDCFTKKIVKSVQSVNMSFFSPLYTTSFNLQRKLFYIFASIVVFYNDIYKNICFHRLLNLWYLFKNWRRFRFLFKPIFGWDWVAWEDLDTEQGSLLKVIDTKTVRRYEFRRLPNLFSYFLL